MSEEIKKLDKNGNLIYYKSPIGWEKWYKYDKNNNLIHCKDSSGFEYWSEFDGNNDEIHCRNNKGDKAWYKWKNDNRIYITEKEYKEIEFRKKEKEYLSRKKCSRFELMEI